VVFSMKARPDLYLIGHLTKILFGFTYTIDTNLPSRFILVRSGTEFRVIIFIFSFSISLFFFINMSKFEHVMDLYMERRAI